MLLDSESPCFYIKSADQSGMPLPLRAFDYTERSQDKIEPIQAPTTGLDSSKFVTKEELEKRLAELTKRGGE